MRRFAGRKSDASYIFLNLKNEVASNAVIAVGDRLLLEHLCSEYPTIIFFLFLLSLSISLPSLCLYSLNVTRVTFGFPSFSSGTVLRCRDRRRRLSIVSVSPNDGLQLSRYSTSIAQTSAHFFPRHLDISVSSSALCWSDFLSSPFLSAFSFLPTPPSVSVSSRHRRIITRKPEFYFTLIERSARRRANASTDVSVVRRTTSLPWFIEGKRILGAQGSFKRWRDEATWWETVARCSPAVNRIARSLST